jgi:hypothetical protein
MLAGKVRPTCELKTEITWEATLMIRSLTLDGKEFELTVRQEPEGIWHWLITAPGELVLSGDAGSEVEALECACQLGRALARLAATQSTGRGAAQSPTAI